MAVYRATRKSAFDDTQYRIDIVPYDAKIGDSVTTIDEGCIVAIGDVEYAFDDVLPYGLANPMTWDVTLNFSRLPSALQTYIRNRGTTFTPAVTLGNVSITGEARNTFLLWTDKGTSGATWTLVFCGVVENTESIEYDVNENGELECNISCLDAAYHTLLEIEGSKLEGYADFEDYDQRNTNSTAYESYTTNARPWLRWNVFFGGQRATANMMQWQGVCDSFQEIITEHLVRIATRSNRDNLSLFDNGNAMYDMVNTGIRMYTPTTSFPRNENAQVDETTAYLPTSIYDANQVRKGGLMDTRDEYGFAQAQSMKDVLSDLCETFGVKAWWVPSYQLDGSEPYIRYDMQVACLLSNGPANGTATAMDLDTSVSTGTVTEGAGLIGKSEARLSLEGDDKNVTDWVALSARSRSERSVNVEPILHNLPTWKTKLEGTINRNTQGFAQTNVFYTPLLYPTGVTEWVKLHEYTVMALRAVAGGGAPVDSYTASSSAQFTDASDNGLRLWLIDVQSNAGLPKALTTGIYNAFSVEKQATVDVTWRISDDVMPDQLGYVHNMSNGVASDLTHMSWSEACITKVVFSPSEHTCTVSYFLPGI